MYSPLGLIDKFRDCLEKGNYSVRRDFTGLAIAALMAW